MSCYLDTSIKESCFGCEACSQVCSKSAISMVEDPDGFRYPAIDPTLCINCGLCRKVCLYENMPPRNKDKKYVFGGYSLDKDIRFESTSC